jgi:hypothetical protein
VLARKRNAETLKHASAGWHAEDAVVDLQHASAGVRDLLRLPPQAPAAGRAASVILPLAIETDKPNGAMATPI